MTTTNTITAGQAVTFDPRALRNWLAVNGYAEGVDVDPDFGRGNGDDALAALDGLLAALDYDDKQTAWTLGADVENIGFYCTTDGDGPDGGIIVVDICAGLRLASLHQEPHYIVSTEEQGSDCYVAMLGAIATEANRIVAAYATVTGTTVEVLSQVVQITIAGHGDVDQHIKDLTAELGLTAETETMALATFTLPDVAGIGGVQIHSDWADVDMATAYCRRVGLPYTQTRQTSYTPA